MNIQEDIDMSDVIDRIAGESTSLELHVDLCQQRYMQLIGKFDVVDQRLDKIETMLIEIRSGLKSEEAQKYRMYLAWAGMAITALTGLAAHLLTK